MVNNLRQHASRWFLPSPPLQRRFVLDTRHIQPTPRICFESFPTFECHSLEPQHLPCILPAPRVQLNGGHSVLASKLQHIL